MRTTSHILLVLLCACGVPHIAPAQSPDGAQLAQALEQTFQAAIAKAEKSVVAIARIRPAPREVVPLDPFGRNPQPRSSPTDPTDPDFLPSEFATGVIVRGPGGQNDPLILTVYHAVRGGPIRGAAAESKYQLFVRFADRRGCNASIIAADPRSDLAVLKPDWEGADIRPADLQPIALGDGGELRKGSWVLTLGNPYAIARDGSASAGRGIVANISRRPAPPGPPEERETVFKETIHHFGTLLQLDARLNLGSSGGAVVNLESELVGVTTSLAALEGYEKSVGYAIPLDRATRRILDSLIRGQEVEYGFLGVRPASISRAQMGLAADKTGQSAAARIDSVFQNSPAERAGVRSNDLVLRVDGQPVFDQRDLVRLVGLLGPDADAELTVWQNRQIRRLRVRLGKWPVYNEDEIISTQPRYPTWRGIDVDYPTARYDFLLQSQLYPRAVVVTKVAAALADRLQAGDFITHVDGNPVETPAEFQRVVRALADKPAALRLVDGRVVEISQ